MSDNSYEKYSRIMHAFDELVDAMGDAQPSDLTTVQRHDIGVYYNAHLKSEIIRLLRQTRKIAEGSGRPTKIGEVNGWDVLYASRVVGMQDPTQIETIVLKNVSGRQNRNNVRSIRVVIDGMGGYEVHVDAIDHHMHYDNARYLKPSIAHLTDNAVSWDKVQNIIEQHLMPRDEDPMGYPEI